MRPLPPTPYTYAEWRERTVAFDYHVDVEQHYYSEIGRASCRERV